MLYLSKIIKSKNGTYLYDATNNRIIQIDKYILDEIKSNKFSKKYYEFIFENKIRNVSEPLKFKIKYPYSYDELGWLTKNRAKSLTLALTEQCNLRCKYCAYMPKYLNSNYKLKNMPEDVAIKAITLFMKASKENPMPSIGFYGGEPLLRFELIKNSVNYCKDKYPFSKPSFDVTTNGLLLSDENITDFLIENNFSLTVSLDGPKSVHDKFRKDINGKESFNKVIKNLIKLYRKSPTYFKNKVSFNSVITPLTGNKEQFDFLENLCRSEIIPIEVMQSDCFKEYLNKGKTQPKSAKSIDKMKYSFLKEGVLKEAVKYHSAYKYSAFRVNIFPGGFCVPGSHRIFVNPSGEIILCERVDDRNGHFCIGNVYTGVNAAKLKNLISITKDKVQRCKTCWAAKMCDVCFRDIFSLTDDFCENKRKEIEEGMTYYLENFKDNKEIIKNLENFS